MAKSLSFCDDALIVDCSQVLAEVGGSLNYDELVVYRNEAIKPAYLVVYDSK